MQSGDTAHDQNNDSFHRPTKLTLENTLVCLKSSPWPKYTKLGTIFQKQIMFHYQTFFLLQICSSLLDCSWQIPEKKMGVTVLA